LNFFLIFLAASFIKHTRQCYSAVNKDTFSRIYAYFSLGVPTAMMVCMDMWAFSLLTFISHFLGVNENAGQVILLNVLSLLYSIPLGFSSGACALIGKNIGKGKVATAKIYAK
jgi:MATE family multidrug resistance protein